ncbi:shikimate dehydrogenase [Ferroacidibacillus organovorans]|uniref:shikimate dehydrogenase n=1 Tax=Ferroacidibacillus organovorans TaxID=1765683 RepID=UPI0012E915FC|nr:shikimate dehydrogenase [Ferroacidibacillus organovorans]
MSAIERMFMVIGDPIAHSLSPVMHRSAYAALSLSAWYGACKVTARDLPDAVRGLRALSVAGCNVTIPHKEAILPLLDDLTARARAVGAVNTVTLRDGRLVGDTTDGEGWLRSYQDAGAPSLAGQTVVILGAGGAARSILYTLLTDTPTCARVFVVNRNGERAARLCASFAHLAKRVDLVACSLDELRAQEVDVIINTTSVGMEGAQWNESPISPEFIRAHHWVSDIVYRPAQTVLLIEAEMRGAHTHGGLGMLVYQGALAFEQWFGVTPPIDRMMAAAKEALRMNR